MIGGYQILDLRGINLQISGSASSITDPYVLKQLLSLRDHIDKAYNFNKPLVNQLKPVLIRFRDKKNGEKTEGATFGEMSVVGNYYTFKITGRISGQFTLIINVAFHEVTNAYDNKEWLINTATIQLADASNVLEGDIAIDGDLSVSGSISGNEIIENMSGYSYGIAGLPPTRSNFDIENVYFGIVKNGNKLTLVYAFNITKLDNSVGECPMCDVTIPEEVYNKLYPTLIGTENVLNARSVDGFYTYKSSVLAQVLTYKMSNDPKLRIWLECDNFAVDTKYFVRIEETFLLSDNLIPNE